MQFDLAFQKMCEAGYRNEQARTLLGDAELCKAVAAADNASETIEIVEDFLETMKSTADPDDDDDEDDEGDE
jgi:hypothetical protein